MEDKKRRRGKTEPAKKSKKGKKKNGKKGKKKYIFTGIIIALIVAALFLTYDQVIKPTVAANNPLSILIVGTDVDSHRDETFEYKPEKTDALMVVTFNPDTYKVVATSIPRDTAVDYICPETGEMRGKINEVYPASGNNMDCLIDTVENFLNIPIDYYVKFNLDQAEDIIDMVGGVTITAHAADGQICQEATDGQTSYCWTDGETYEMSGDEAVNYARARSDSEQDYGRGVRQQQVVKATFQAIAQTGFSVDLIKSLFGLVETNMEAKLLYDYYNYFMAIATVMSMYSGETPIDEGAVPHSVWQSLFDAAGYKSTTINNEEIEKFFAHVKDHESEMSDYFIDNYQFVNEKADGFFVAVDEQRYEISNALRVNLGLREEYPPAYQYAFATNDLGEKKASGGTPTPNYVEDQPDVSTAEPVEEAPVEVEPTVVDSDGDGYSDENDSCPNTYPTVDDGTGCEAEEVEPEIIDTDGDGYTDDVDGCPNTYPTVDDGIGCEAEPEVVDTDGDGYSDENDSCPDLYPTVDDGTGCELEEVPVDTDGDGYTDDIDLCEGSDDNIDEDVDGIPDGCDDEVLLGDPIVSLESSNRNNQA